MLTERCALMAVHATQAALSLCVLRSALWSECTRERVGAGPGPSELLVRFLSGRGSSLVSDSKIPTYNT